MWAILAGGLALIGVSFLMPSQSAPPRQERADSKHLLDPSLGVEDKSAFSQLQMRQQKDHPVTEQMTKEATELSAKQAPYFELTATSGLKYNLTSLTETKPLLIFFVEKECPCCLGAKYFVDKLMMLYGDSLNAVAIINAEGDVANKWVRSTKPMFPVLQDPMQKTIRAFSAKAGVYTTLVAPGGKIDSAYPGYSKKMLNELSKRISVLSKAPFQEFHSAYAPDTLTTGCVFPEPKKS